MCIERIEDGLTKQQPSLLWRANFPCQSKLSRHVTPSGEARIAKRGVTSVSGYSVSQPRRQNPADKPV